MKDLIPMPKTQLLFKPLLPGLLGVFMLIVETALQGLQAMLFKEQEINISHAEKFSIASWPAWLLESSSNSLKNLSSTIFESYNNYFSFIVMMLFLHAFLQGLKLLTDLINKDDYWWHNSKLIKGQLRSTFSTKQFIKSIVVYSLVFCFYQVLWICIVNILSNNIHIPNEPLKKIEKLDQQQMVSSNRLLTVEELSVQHVEKEQSESRKYKKPSLSIGKVRSEVDVDIMSMILSNDEKTIFAIDNGSQKTLKIIDVSDFDIPKILSSQVLSKSIYELQSFGLSLSSDETKLYISNGDSLEIFDVSNLSSPFKIALAQDKKAGERTKGSSLDIDISTKLRILTSKDDEFIFIGGLGLQVFDISRVSTPLSVSSIRSQTDNGKLVPTSIALSSDRQTLYYTDGSFWIYDASDPINLKVVKSFTTGFIISSMRLSKDTKTAYILGRNSDKKILLQKLNVSSETSSIKQDGEIIQLNQTSSCAPVFMEQAPGDLFLFIQIQDPINKKLMALVFDTNEKQILTHKKMFVNNASSILFTEDYEKMFVGSDDKRLKIVDLYLDFPNRNSFCGVSNIIQTFESKVGFTANTFPSSDGSFIYSWSDEGRGSSKTFGIQRFTPNSSKLVMTRLYESTRTVSGVIVSPDNQRAYWIDGQVIYIMNISDIKNVTVISKYEREYTRSLNLHYFVLSQDGKTGYLSYGYDVYTPVKMQYNLVEIFDFSNPKVPTRKSVSRIEHELGCMTLSKDEQILFVAGPLLAILNVSNSSSPVLLANISLLSTGISESAGQLILSHDEKILFIKEERAFTFVNLRIVDVSNLTSPRVLSAIRLPCRTDQITRGERLAISADSKTAYLMHETFIFVIDVSNPSLPRYLGAIKTIDSELDFKPPEKFTEQQDWVNDFRLSVDRENAILATKLGKIHFVSLQPIYSMFLAQDIVMLGESYHINVMVLKMDQKKIYNAIDVGYKLIDFRLVEARSSQSADFAAISYKMRPPWISFDFKSQILAVEPRGKNDIRIHRMSFTFTTRVNVSLFSSYFGYGEAIMLMATLRKVGYIDNQEFLTEKFGSYEDFHLPSNYKVMRQLTYFLLQKFTIQTFNELEVVSSLNLTCIERLSVITPSRHSLRVEIILGSAETRFLTKSYSSLVPNIVDQSRRIIFEGSLNEVNIALQEIVVNFEDDAGDLCDGFITVDDKLNPVINETIKNMSRFFKVNSQPRLNENFSISIQEQAERYPILTGQYFQIKLSEKTFFDEHTPVEKLNYQLVFVKTDNSEITLPNWLTFSDMVLSGVAPESLFDQEYKFKLTVKNEFKQFEISFGFEVGISWNYVLKLIMQYCPYILSIVGLIIKKNKILNVIVKKSYRHLKEFYLSVGQEITSEVIFPIFFISQERKEADKVLECLKRGVSEEYKGEGKKKKSQWLLNYFITEDEERKLDKQKIIEKAREYGKIRGLRLYLRGPELQKLTIDQLIVNYFVREQLKMKEEKETKKYFEKIKKQWENFVEWDSSISAFKINQKNFDKQLQVDDEEETILEENFPNVNVDLLKNALLAHTFDCQSLKASPLNVNLEIREKVEANFLKRLLKLDLLDSGFHGTDRIGHGIRYQKSFNRLFFSGMVKEDFIEKTIVIQIKNSKERILKEIWIRSDDLKK